MVTSVSRTLTVCPRIDRTPIETSSLSWRAGFTLLIVMTVSASFAQSVSAQDLSDTRRLVREGKYDEALDTATQAVEGNVFSDEWPRLKGEIELLLGRWDDAKQTLEQAIERHSWSIHLRWLAREAYRRTGDDESAKRMLQEILKLAEASPWRYTQPPNLVVLGEVALEMGADAKDVLDAFFQRAQQANAGSREPVKAIGRLALSKNDFQLAAATFREGLEQFEGDPDLLYGLAAAVRDTDPPKTLELIEQALSVNPQHVPSLLLVADKQIDAENYAAAETTLLAVREVNPFHDQALSYLAVLAHLANDHDLEAGLREQALSSWTKNPSVDHLIGKKLSQKYRFREGADRQFQALKFDPSYLPARRQVASDLLRLGEEEAGWKMAAGVFEEDEYDVTAYNLVTLRDEIAKFTTLEDESFILRMETREAAIYGQRVLELLNRAKSHLCAKYELDLREKVLVELFPNPADFEVRTFGMPGISGFLGVCFGTVITANSPAAQSASPSNWEAVLWHEFCHVVTLQLTHNRMPRWLSEGISVYEERQADPRWGQTMTPTYRQRILDGQLVPVSELSRAFTTPGADIQFAYYESSLVVQFLIEEYGLEAMHLLLGDLGEGIPINEALPRHTDDLLALEAGFFAYAMDEAHALAPDADWEKPDIAGLLADDQSEPLMRDWIVEHPHNIAGLKTFAELLMQNEKWEEAKTTWQHVIELYPGDIGASSPYLKLADIHRRQGDTKSEAHVLEELAARDATSGSTFLRLMELAQQREDGDALDRNARRLMAVNPLTTHPHAALAETAERKGDAPEAVRALGSLLVMNPDDPAELHFRLATNLDRLKESDDAKRHVLMALENAPRYRDAQRLLLKLTSLKSSTSEDKNQKAKETSPQKADDTDLPTSDSKP